ncbi:hypothetical protein [Pedobacter sp. JY14-1]|uniref:hypothetical protein n=1 Tax=Pedobacter sp. JY14-1 TaxID=3034151 RepID=UPI0023E13055|nr:hypothetical protein [Pedobacter sp. JY14-1]
MSEENKHKNPFEGLDRKEIEELIHKRQNPSRPDASIEKGIQGGLNEGYQPTKNISGLPPGADKPDKGEEE